MATQDSIDVSGNSGMASCVLCGHVIGDSIYLYKPPCGHPLHKSCYQKNVKSKPNCVVCNKRLANVSTPSGSRDIPPPMVTRSQTQRTINFDSNRSVNTTTSPTELGNQNIPQRMSVSESSPQDQRDHIRNLVTAAVGAQQAEMLTSLSQTLTKLIETNIEAGFRRLHILNQPVVDESSGTQSQRREVAFNTDNVMEQQSLEGLLGLPSSNTNMNRGNLSFNNSGSNLSSIRPDKIGHIIHNWKIRFSGELRGMSVDNFLYRVEALTIQTLNGNFNLLCDHISTLFDGKANDWFWRYHHSVEQTLISEK